MSDEPEAGPSADEPSSRLATLWSVLANWRDWNLPVKLAAVTLVPVIFAIVLGTMQISDQVDRASSYRRVDRLVVVDQELRGLIGALQRERGTAAVLLAARAADVGTQIADEQEATDGARARFLRAAGRVTLDHEIAAARYADALTWLDELVEVRRQAVGPMFEAGNAITRYTSVIDALLRFDRTMAAEAIDPELASTASALYDLEAIREQIEYQRALIGIGIVRGGLVGPERIALQSSMARLGDRITDFYAIAGAGASKEFDSLVTGTGIAARNNVVETVITNRAGEPIPTTVPDWEAASDLAANRVAEVAASLATLLRDRSATLQDEASDGAGLAAVILLVALVVAVAVMFVVGRHLLSSLSALRRRALDIAERTLPDAVARIRDRGEDAASIKLDPVAVWSLDEVGQVARAFDAVQRQALRLATEQAGMRAKYSSVFVNLSRRSQGLVQRQLHLLERLERDEEDPDQLATLFQLDHLATRMRRNNENLMVLSGSEVGRRAQRPANLADLLRASVSEIEQYQRVVLLPPPDVVIVGYAVGDLVRLVAELLDNATVFSAPDTQVTIASHSFEDGSVCVAVLDEGIGMNQDELDEANRKLADSGSIDVSTSRRMGLFVIGRLAGRHGIEVRLNGGTDTTGVRATVTIRADVVAQAPAPSKKEPSAPKNSLLAPFSLNGVAPPNGHNGLTNGAKVNGSVALPSPDESDIARRLEGEEPEPLPRRSPGDRLPAPTPDPFMPPSGEAGGWWSADDRSALEETTPIFDEMMSAWFRAATEEPEQEWEFEADSGFDTARAVSRAEPSDFTPSGLPRRSRGENLVPGSAGQSAAPSAPKHGREADDVRERLANYRHGVRRARDHRQGDADPGALPVTQPDSADTLPSGADPGAMPGNTGRDASPSKPAEAGRTGETEELSDPAGTLDSGGPEAAIRPDLPDSGGSAGSAGSPRETGQASDHDERPARGRPAQTKSGLPVRRAKHGQSTRTAKPAQSPPATPSQSPTAKSSRPAKADQAAKSKQSVPAAKSGQASLTEKAEQAARAMKSARAAKTDRAKSTPAAKADPAETASHAARPGQAARAEVESAGRAPEFGEAGPAGQGAPAAKAELPRRAPNASQAARAAEPSQAAQAAKAGGSEQAARPAASSQAVPGAESSAAAWAAESRGSARVVDSGQSGRPGEAWVAESRESARVVDSGQLRRSGEAAWVAEPRVVGSGRPGRAVQPGEAVRVAKVGESARVVDSGQPGGAAWAAEPGESARDQAARSAWVAESGQAAWVGEAAQRVQSGQAGQPSWAGQAARVSEPVPPAHPANPATDDTAQLDLTGAGWRFAADVGWRAANAVSTSTPVDFTSGGLPRRTRGERLVPGSVAAVNGVGPLRVDRAEELRGRLGSFQRGLSRGRRSLAERHHHASANPQQQENE